jgi:hypothetical protein
VESAHFHGKFQLPEKHVKTKSYKESEALYGAHTARAESLLMSAEGQRLAPSRQGALFSLGSVAPGDRHRYTPPPERRSEHALLDAVFDLAGRAADSAVDMGALEDRLGLKRPAILKAVGTLMTSGVLRKSEIAYYPGRRSVTLYVFVPADDLPSAPPPALSAEPPQLDLPMGEDLFNQAVQLRYDPMLDRNMPWKGERLVVFNLTALLRSGRTGANIQIIQTQIRQGKRYCQAEARAAAGTMLAGVLDLRPLVVLLTLVRQHLKALDGRPAENLFTIRLRDICEAMAIESSSSNIRATFAQIKRWWQTTYLIIDDLYGMFDWAPNLFDKGQGFSVISGLDYVSWIGRNGVTPEMIRVRLHPPIYEALKESDRALSVHKEIIQDRELHPLRHKLYYWCRRVVQHEHEPRQFLLDHVREEIDPKKPLPEFRREIREALAPEMEAGRPYQARVPGYRLWYQPNERRPKNDLLLIGADPRDGIVGEGSAYARRQIAQEQSSGEGE